MTMLRSLMIFAVLAAGIAEASGRPVDLVDLRTAGVHLTGVILRTGKRLVCRQPRIWAELLARNLIDAVLVSSGVRSVRSVSVCVASFHAPSQVVATPPAPKATGR